MKYCAYYFLNQMVCRIILKMMPNANVLPKLTFLIMFQYFRNLVLVDFFLQHAFPELPWKEARQTD